QDSVRLTATVFDVGSGTALADLELHGTAARMDRLSDSLTVGVLRELGRTRPIGAVRLASLGSTSLPAIKAFLRGEQFYRRAVWDSALVYARRAVAIDSNFTLALRRIPLVLWWSISDTSWTTYELRAGALNHGLAPRESLLVAADSLWGALDQGEASEWPLMRHLVRTLRRPFGVTRTTRKSGISGQRWHISTTALFRFRSRRTSRPTNGLSSSTRRSVRR